MSSSLTTATMPLACPRTLSLAFSGCRWLQLATTESELSFRAPLAHSTGLSSEDSNAPSTGHPLVPGDLEPSMNRALSLTNPARRSLAAPCRPPSTRLRALVPSPDLQPRVLAVSFQILTILPPHHHLPATSCLSFPHSPVAVVVAMPPLIDRDLERIDQAYRQCQ
jgi:hypothetical protein